MLLSLRQLLKAVMKTVESYGFKESWRLLRANKTAFQ